MAMIHMSAQKKFEHTVFFCFLIVGFFIFFSPNTIAQSDSLLANKSDSKPYYFYHGYTYGSQAMFNPLTLVLNTGYDICQLNANDRHIFNFPYAVSLKNVFWNLGHPNKVIGEVGWDKFMRTEILPLSFSREGGQWMPNYVLHLFGGGMSYVTISEWYRYHDVKYPRLLGFVTVMAADILNETMEDNGYIGSNSDPIPDMYFFNFAGIALFSSKKVCKFFSEELHMADWSLQPAITFTDISLYNCGQYFSFKWELPFERRLSLFTRMGLGTLIGASWKFNNGTALSLGAGVRSGERVLLPGTAREVTVTTPFSIGVFYDRNNSLLASLVISNVNDYFINANVYPGLLRIGKFSTGLWAVIDKKGYPAFGFATRYTFGLGLGANFMKY